MQHPDHFSHRHWKHEKLGSKLFHPSSRPAGNGITIRTPGFYETVRRAFPRRAPRRRCASCTLLAAVDAPPDDAVLDVGCGYFSRIMAYRPRPGRSPSVPIRPFLNSICRPTIPFRTRPSPSGPRIPPSLGPPRGEPHVPLLSGLEEVAGDRVRWMWSQGDYSLIAPLLQPCADELADAIGLTPGMEALDVAAGTCNFATAAAARGARVTATDLTPLMVELGSRRTQGVKPPVTWREADAEALPFADASFDVVASVFGAMFAPRHELVAAEMFRE